MEAALISSFLLVSLTLACTPGADWAYIISSALGRSSYAPAVLGLLSGYLIHTALVAGGIAAVVASSPGLLTWLTMAGALYLFWLGLSTLRSWKSARFYGAPEESPAPRTPAPCEVGSSSSSLALATQSPKVLSDWKPKFFKGLLTSATNPKALLLYVALIPQFISKSAQWPLPVQTAALGLTHFSVSILVYFSVALAARILLRSRPVAARIVTICSGLIMIGLACVLVVEQLWALP